MLALPLVLLVGEPATRREFAADRAALRSHGFWVASAAIMFAALALGVLEGVLPLHFAERLSQAQIGAMYVGASLVVAVSAAASGGVRPRAARLRRDRARRGGDHAGRDRCGRAALALALLLAAVGIGLGNTGSLGLLVEAVPVERIVTAMVVWSQIGIVGYLLGPLAGGIVAEGPGYAYVGLVPATAAAALLLR